jgi:hypothetical protein
MQFCPASCSFSLLDQSILLRALSEACDTFFKRRLSISYRQLFPLGAPIYSASFLPTQFQTAHARTERLTCLRTYDSRQSAKRIFTSVRLA